MDWTVHGHELGRVNRVSTGKRNVVWDIVKGLGILFVVAGHGFQGDVSKFVNLFHIPLFFFVSGLVFKFIDRSFKEIVNFFLKCMKALWLPSLLYGTFYVLMHNTFVTFGLYDLEPYSVKQTATSIIKHIGFLKTEPLESAMWFLTAIFIGKFLLYGVLWISSLFEKNVRKQTVVEIVIITLIFAMGCLFFYKGVSLPGNADNACSLVPYMYAGYKLKKRNLSRTWLIIPSLVIMIVLLVITGQTLRMSRNELVNPLFFLVVSTAGVCFTFQCATLLKNWKLCVEIFSYLGRNTIPILCLHLLAFRLVSLIWIKCSGLSIELLSKHPVVGPSYFWGILYTLFGLAAPLVVPIVKSRIKKAGRI